MAQQTSALLNLPAELRNRIYEYVVTDARPVDIKSERQPGLARTCRKLRSEWLRMYYARNQYTFAPTTRSDDALRQVEQWLVRLGPVNCGALQRLVFTVSNTTGLLIIDSGAKTDPWASLFGLLRSSGCVSRLSVGLRMDKDTYPSGKAFDAGMARLGSKKALDARAEQQRYMMRLKLKAYFTVLRQREFNKIRFEAWEAEHFAAGDFVQLVRNGACFGDTTPYWNEGLLTAHPSEWRAEEVVKGLCKFLRVFHEDRAKGDVRIDNPVEGHCAR